MMCHFLVVLYVWKFIEWDKCSSQNLFFKSMRNKEKLHCRWLLNANCNFLTTNSSTLTMNPKDLQAAITKLNFDLNSECLDINLLKTCEWEIHFWFDSKWFQLQMGSAIFKLLPFLSWSSTLHHDRSNTLILIVGSISNFTF